MADNRRLAHWVSPAKGVDNVPRSNPSSQHMIPKSTI
jgi:hypothetical protein